MAQDIDAPAKFEDMVAFSEHLKKHPKEALSFFQNAGILDEHGNLTKQYYVDDWLDSDGYPTEAALNVISSWPYDGNPYGWFEFIKGLWWMPDYGWHESITQDSHFGDTKVHQYKISTGGWSGNESIIYAMGENLILWSTTWVQSRRGGHYIFEEKLNESEV